MRADRAIFLPKLESPHSKRLFRVYSRKLITSNCDYFECHPTALYVGHHHSRFIILGQPRSLQSYRPVLIQYNRTCSISNSTTGTHVRNWNRLFTHHCPVSHYVFARVSCGIPRHTRGATTVISHAFELSRHTGTMFSR